MNNAAVERFYNAEGKLGVLVSRGYGAGWSTWNTYGIDLAIDKRIIKTYMEYKAFGRKANLDSLCEWFDSIGYKDIYMGGWEDLDIVWIDKGTTFRIDEYDGAETIEKLDDQDWCTV